MAPANHPNIELHNALVEAAKRGELDENFIKESSGNNETLTVDRTASAYVNWNTTLALLSETPAMYWFTGVSKQIANNSIIARPVDKLRDDLSVGQNYYFRNSIAYDRDYYFSVEVLDKVERNTDLLIEVYDRGNLSTNSKPINRTGRLVAVFHGSATMNVQIQNTTFEFFGNGLWGRNE